MPSEQTILSWADAIDAAMGYDENEKLTLEVGPLLKASEIIFELNF